MKKVIFIIVCVLFALNVNAQTLLGAWESKVSTEDGKNLRFVATFTDGFQSAAVYDSETGEFISTNGGKWRIEGKTVTEIVEFDSANPERVGSEISFDIDLDNNTLTILDGNIVFNRIDDGTPGDLNGAWLMSGRVRDGELQMRDTDRPRKTMKILSGTRFQWIAYNTETKEFMGTGGGTYTTKDGHYTEHIEFFSRDNTRVGASLKFDYNIKDGDWHHTGFSSKGDPLNEVWSPRSN